MPVCTTCACPADYIYTTYKTKSNIRLAVCPRCNHFVDPLIEHPSLLLLLDLILLKPRVFLHLLFNRGSLPFSAVSEPVSEVEREVARRRQLWEDFSTLALLSVGAETAVRLLPTLSDPRDSSDIQPSKILWTIIAVLLEGMAQHLATLGLSMLALKLRYWNNPVSSSTDKHQTRQDGRRKFFVPILIPLTLLYTSLLPLLFQLFLFPWYTTQQTIHEQPPAPSLSLSLLSSLPLPSSVTIPPSWLDTERQISEAWARGDRIWAGTRLLGGMSAGYGLRVLLPTKPWETTLIVLAGWIAAAFVGKVIAELPLGL
ncbi:hypothetical protein I308_104146 [Cryptococcus tetragattii IND107]|uniref:Protein ARV n=1 Tax=Cryptococcus tetragattii IND107 TaxID=1296105 RepID=A0ABR3BPJ7_9TREE|nr:hypothetical protein I308_00730 [Cryptococcus tetragattii IND107]